MIEGQTLTKSKKYCPTKISWAYFKDGPLDGFEYINYTIYIKEQGKWLEVKQLPPSQLSFNLVAAPGEYLLRVKGTVLFHYTNRLIKVDTRPPMNYKLCTGK